MQETIRYAIRALKRTPGFTFLAVGSIAVGIGACTAVFSLVNAVYFRPLPFRPAGQLAVIEPFASRQVCKSVCRADLTVDQIDEWAGSLSAIDALAAVSSYRPVVSDRAGTVRADGALVSANVLSLLGVRPSLGRLFDAGDARADASPVVMLSDAFWRGRYHSDSSVLGTALDIDGSSAEIVGVLPSSGAIGRPLYIGDSRTAQFVMPLGPYAARKSGSVRSYTLLARLRPGQHMEALRAQLTVLLAHAAPSTRYAPTTASVLPLREAHARAVAGSSYVLFLGAVAFVLLIVCLNVAGLFLARFQVRRHDTIIRAALGATRVDIVRQLALEGVVCAAVGGALGVAFAVWGLPLARFLPVRGVPYWTSFVVDGRVIAFAVGLVLVTGVLIGVIPALVVSARHRDLSRRSRGLRRPLLIALEMQLALVLLTGAGLFGKAFVTAATVDMGVATQSVLLASLDPRGPGPMSPADRQGLAERLLTRLQGLPGVVAAAAVASGSSASIDAVTPDYFRAWGIPLVQGRAFTASDVAGAPPVVVLDVATARQLYPDGHALGKSIKLDDNSALMTIVGIVGTRRRGVLPSHGNAFEPQLYQPFLQSPAATGGVTFVVGTRGSSDAVLLPSVRAVIAQEVPTLPLARLTTVEMLLDREVAPLRLNAVVLGSFGVIALVVAALGVYGVVAQLVAERSVEAGLRMALGCPRGGVLWLMIRPALLASLAGIAGGLIGSFLLVRVVQAFLSGVNAADPSVFVGAAVVLAATALAAAYIPARRATHIDPAVAMRAL